MKEGRLKCSYCGTIYLLGDPTPNMQLPYYPDGERRYWGHCLTEDHMKVMRVRDASQRQMLEALPTVLPEAKKGPEDPATPGLPGTKGSDRMIKWLLYNYWGGYTFGVIVGIIAALVVFR